MFSILIPNWTNLEYLSLCVRSIRENSAHPHQTIVHVNDGSDGSDGSRGWVCRLGDARAARRHLLRDQRRHLLGRQQGGAARRPRPVVYLNDDMHCLPGWDRAAATPAWWWPTVAIQSQSVSTAGPR